MYEEKVRKFGKTYGRYDGVKPALVTIDPELVKSIIVKNFDSFHGIIDIPVCTENNDILYVTPMTVLSTDIPGGHS